MEAKTTKKSKHHATTSVPNKQHTTHKTIAIKDHHKKPYRKRHFALLFVSLVTAFGLFGVLIAMQTQVLTSLNESRDFISNIFARNVASTQTVTSSYGFSFSYDPKQFTSSAIDGSTGQLYAAGDLASTRPYQTIKLTSGDTQTNTPVAKAVSDHDSVLINYYPAEQVPLSLPLTSLEQKYIAVKTGNAPVPTVTSTEMTTHNGVSYQRSTWLQTSSGKFTNNITTKFITYTSVVHGHPLIVRTNNQLGKVSGDSIEKIIDSLTLSMPQASDQAYTASSTATSVASTSASLMKMLDFSGTASAADSTTLDSKDLSALYTPSVVKVYNFYCTDIRFKNQLIAKDACLASTGSGFFVGSDGYIATNGHVATSNAKDVAIYNAFMSLLLGDESLLEAITTGANIDLNKIATIQDTTEQSSAIIDALDTIPEDEFKKENNVENLLVGLNHNIPDYKELAASTKNRKEFSPNASIKKATLKAYDYRQFDGLTKFTNSDVAIMKIDGENYPVSYLGSIDSISQGSPLNIIGFPGAASDNALVSDTDSEATLTTGKVSSIKKAKGDTRKLIETDTTLGHGNSGGPAYNDKGDVIGIATYTINGASDSDATYNYIRDIQDLKTLANKSNIVFDQTSKTQSDWDSAMKQFNTSHFSAALKNFSAVKTLYPAHPTVDTFIQKSEQNIKDGKDVSDFPTALLFAGVAVALLIAGVATLLIVKHHARHHVYAVTSGQATVVPVGQVAVYDSTPGTPAYTTMAAPQQVTQPYTAPASVPLPAPEPAQVQIVQPAVTQIPVNDYSTNIPQEQTAPVVSQEPQPYVASEQAPSYQQQAESPQVRLQEQPEDNQQKPLV